MRRANAVLSGLILMLFLLHAVLGAFQLIGVGMTPKWLSWLLLGLVALHTLLGIWLTIRTLRVTARSGVSYWKGNELFWARRISGFAIMVLIAFHVTAFSVTVDGALRLVHFDFWKLLTQLLLLLSIAAHVLMNLRPLLLSFGIPAWCARAGELWVALSILLCCMAAALMIYWMRWNVW